MTSLRSLLAALAFLSLGVSAEEAVLKNNLFGSPLPTNLVAPRAGRDQPNDGPLSSQAPSWQPALKAILCAGRNSLINLNGMILKTGDEINGYRVARITETQVILKSRNETITLDMDQATSIPAPANLPGPAPERSTVQPAEGGSPSE